jgi:hypothetical protein
MPLKIFLLLIYIKYNNIKREYVYRIKQYFRKFKINSFNTGHKFI